MAKGDAKRERQRRREEFKADMAELTDLTDDELEAAIRYVETWWADGLSGARRLISVLAYIKVNGVDEFERAK